MKREHRRAKMPAVGKLLVLLSGFPLCVAFTKLPSGIAHRKVLCPALHSVQGRPTLLTDSQEVKELASQHGEPLAPASSCAAPSGVSWSRQWYALSFLEDLPDTPKAITVLGKQLVIWREKQGEWRVFADACPHRLARLSEGRIDPISGDLQCCYHGWTFDATGTCTWIPQAGADEHATAVASRRGCVVSYPSAVHQDVLFVFPDASVEGREAAASTPVPHLPELDAEDYTEKGSTFSRELPYNYDTFLENNMDPAHVPFVHHGARGATQTTVQRKNARPVEMVIQHFNESNFKVDLCDPQTLGRTELELVSPSQLRFKLDLTAPLSQSPLLSAVLRVERALHRVLAKDRSAKVSPPTCFLNFYGTPVMPGVTRVFLRVSRNFLRFLPASRLLSHFNSMGFFDGDNALLHYQEREMQRRKYPEGTLDKLFYMPTSSDTAVRIARRWFKEYAGEGIQWEEGVDPSLPPAYSRRAIFDRYHSHVSHCSTCQSALRKWRLAKSALGFSSFITLVALAVHNPTRIGSGLVRRGMVTTCVLAAALAAALHASEKPLFFASDYVHANK